MSFEGAPMLLGLVDPSGELSLDAHGNQHRSCHHVSQGEAQVPLVESDGILECVEHGVDLVGEEREDVCVIRPGPACGLGQIAEQPPAQDLVETTFVQPSAANWRIGSSIQYRGSVCATPGRTRLASDEPSSAPSRVWISSAWLSAATVDRAAGERKTASDANSA